MTMWRGTTLRRGRATETRSGPRWSTRRQVGAYVVLILGALVFIIPFVWMFTTSLSRRANQGLPRIPTFWPPDPSDFNYMVASANLPLVQFYANSLITVTAVTLGYLFFSSLAGYVFAKGRFPFRGPLFLLFLFTLFIPFPMQMIPLYLLVKDLGLSNSLAGLVVPFLVGGFGIFFMRQSMMSIPDDLVDAARLDGAGELRIYRSVMLPLCGPALATLAVISVLWRWNDVLWPILVNSERSLYTVTQGLAIAGRSQGIFTGVAMATAAMAILPVIVAYIIFQRWIIRGIATTGTRG
ncbi:MAG: carbohydrate ABC transporter permease [Chloroflexi bacterium]|nr:carbohydrate ABC transporter permease [Chloroflexota bacterium]